MAKALIVAKRCRYAHHVGCNFIYQPYLCYLYVAPPRMEEQPSALDMAGGAEISDTVKGVGIVLEPSRPSVSDLLQARVASGAALDVGSHP
jgi:hypothetical protein